MAMQTLIIETPVLYDTKFYSYGFRDSDVNHEEQLEFQQLKLEWTLLSVRARELLAFYTGPEYIAAAQVYKPQQSLSSRQTQSSRIKTTREQQCSNPFLV